MRLPFPRRKFLKAALTTGTASEILLINWGSKVLAAVANPETSSVFSHGVATGDPTHDRVSLWTRVSAADTKTVSWELALDSDLSRIVQSSSSETSHAFWAN
tara:strand:- start:16 stop:321 length:306 start_codon:yes stop_codon:yes gene_type:complete